MKLISAFVFLLVFNLAYSQDLYFRSGIITKNYSSEHASIYLPGLQLSLGTSQKESQFNLDFAYSPINTLFLTSHGDAPFLEEGIDTLVNYSGKGIFSFRFTTYILNFSKSRHEFGLGAKFGFDKPMGKRKNTILAFDVKDELSSLNLGLISEYQYFISHKHAAFINLGLQFHFFGIFDNSSIEHSRIIKGLRPFTGYLNIGYSFYFIRA